MVCGTRCQLAKHSKPHLFYPSTILETEQRNPMDCQPDSQPSVAMNHRLDKQKGVLKLIIPEPNALRLHYRATARHYACRRISTRNRQSHLRHGQFGAIVGGAEIGNGPADCPCRLIRARQYMEWHEVLQTTEVSWVGGAALQVDVLIVVRFFDKPVDVGWRVVTPDSSVLR